MLVFMWDEIEKCKLFAFIKNLLFVLLCYGWQFFQNI